MTQPKAVMPVQYKDQDKIFPSSFSYHEELRLDYSDQSRYLIAEKLGYGKYSDVFKGYDRDDPVPIVIKVLKPVRMAKVYREVKILTDLLGGPFVMKLKDVVSVKNSDYPAFIMEFGGDCLQSLSNLNLKQLKLIAGQLLLALHWCHIHSIIHRDVKGGNICFNTQTNRLTLLDFGLAEFYSYGKQLHHRVATRHYKPPELLCNYQLYDYSLDIWSTGAMLAGFLFQRNPFFRGTTNNNQLDKVVEILGSADFIAMTKKYNIDLGAQRMRELSGYQPANFKSFINSDNQHLIDANLIDLQQQMLKYDPEKRPTAENCLKHRWFDDVRQDLAKLYIQEFADIENHLKTEFKLIPKPCFPSYEYAEGTKYPIPLSPNELANEFIFDENRWINAWTEFQKRTNQIGAAIQKGE
ncbi:Kinase [Hexamita inflata]|uniref:non-specific serine/threonine protein kinase n=1 Tax=Hexamita inflata TaxID=28002 RepID=A0AA86UY38_9EUKA|nr:CMGC CK2 [Hexamita inflata]